MLKIDPATMMIMIAISAILQSVIIIGLALSVNQYKGISVYAIGTVLSSFGFLAIVLDISPLSSFVIPPWIINSTLVYSILCCSFGISFFLDRKIYYPKWLFLATLFPLIQFYFTQNYDYFWRNFFICLVGSLFHGLSFINLIHLKKIGFRIMALSLAIIVFLTILLFLIRTIYLIQTNTQSILQSTIDNVLTFMGIFILDFLRHCFFMLMVSQRMYFDLHQVSKTDFLTQLLNRGAITNLIEKSMSEQAYTFFSIILLDIDYFKKINDTYGHDVGDLVLKQVAQLLTSQMTSKDLLGRWGGEEFLCFWPECSPDLLTQRVENLRHQVETMVIRTPQGVISCTISLGVATTNMGSYSFDEVVKAADLALYRVKKNGRNGFELVNLSPPVKPPSIPQ
ncbi:GGDEF domain-containing protein [Spirulina subsalsa FACHB-351]|uniref:GGDEF domain-containing protein n=1 Tax=Spirulina subsalsa FACHB-351 TaxID=234711 RepID=A0ABT3LAY2_9CYAN|nr:GGDEF domain-containing protein [Spirulina subsalsa]MCW6038653.1 GGDEF domain-containing protein [Spirulina subsalsa FACHB-351]